MTDPGFLGDGAPTIKGRGRGWAPTYYWDNYEEIKKIGPQVKIVEGSFTLSECESENFLSVMDPGFLRRGGRQLPTTKEERQPIIRPNFPANWTGGARPKFFNFQLLFIYTKRESKRKFSFIFVIT